MKIKGRFLKKTVSLSLIVMILASLFSGVTVTAKKDNTIDYNAEMKLSKELDIDSISFDPEGGAANQVQINYSVEPEAIKVSDLPSEDTQKEVVIIIDKSGSMGMDVYGNYINDSRLSIVKTAANNFVTQLSAHANIDVAIVDYSNVAKVYTNSSRTFFAPSVTTDKFILTNKINSITESGGTNIGDALRQAYNILDNDNTSAQKYVVFLTDGQPTALSYQSGTVAISDEDVIGMITDGNGNKLSTVTNVGFTNADYFKGTGSAPNAYVNYTYSDDYNGYATDYAQVMASQLNISNTGIKSYFIAFSDVAAANKLAQISTYADATYKQAMSATDIQLVYDGIAEEITSDIIVSGVRFEEILPDELQVISVPLGMEVEGQFVGMSFDDIKYTLNSKGDKYEAEPIEFSIVVEALSIGDIKIGENDSSGFHYKDLDGTIQHIFFDELKLKVVEKGLKSDKLNILEIQPGQEFELSRGALQEEFDKYSVTLTQLSMSEFIGHVDEVNGYYDIIYIGMIEDYKGLNITGKSTSIVKDIDITNKKAAQLIDFVDAGQLLIIDEDTLAYSGSKLKANLDTIKNKDSVELVESADKDFFDDIKEWYKDATHRPVLTVTEAPSAYDGTQGSYLPDHMMKYIYNAYNEEDHSMTLNLYLDVNGDGRYTNEENADISTINKNVVGLGLNFNLYEDFNGCMPWKLELVDNSTNAKDVATGFVAMKGEQTIVNVLNLIPSSASLDFDNAGQFLASLVTEDYEINITRMYVDDFNDNYPDPVGEVATELNGYYDMILFGFGDSYENKDITSQAALDGIRDFIETKQSVMFTHDLAGPADASVDDNISFYDDAPIITENFKTDMGFSDVRTEAGTIPHTNWKAWGSNQAYMQNAGLITMYPYVLANNASKILNIATTHDQYWELDLENPDVVPWFNLNAGDYKYLPQAYYYTFSNGTITYSGTGHSTPDGREEQELFVNTMLKASRGANHAPTLEFVDLYEGMNVIPSIETMDFEMKIMDSDIADRIFHSEFYIVVEGQEDRLVFETDDIEKAVFTEISLLKELDNAVTEFVLRVEVSDPHGAKAIEEFNLSHNEIATLLVEDNLEDGYLVGDIIDLEFLVTTLAEEDKEFISNIEVTTTIDSEFLPVNTYEDFDRFADAYTMTPVFDDLDTEDIDETDVDRTMEIEVVKEGDTSILLEGTYDMQLSDSEDADPIEREYEKEIPLEIKSGIIRTEVKDNIDRPVPEAIVVIKDEEGEEVARGETDDSGLFEQADLPTGTYTIEVEEVPDNYEIPDEPSQEADMNYEDHDQTVTFESADSTSPEVYSKHDYGFLSRLTNPVLDVHIKVDGVNSKIIDVQIKELPAGTTHVNELEFLALPASTEVTFEDDVEHEDYFTLNPEAPEDYEQLHKFEVTDNGYFAVYVINESGNVTVKVIQISNFLDVEPDLL